MTRKECVLQEWILGLSWKKQTVLMECIRAPDSKISLRFKQITTFIRSVVLKNADPTTDFMLNAELPEYAGIVREFERLPLHMSHHIFMTLEVIGYDHPDEEIRRISFEFYQDGVHSQHLNIETKEEYENRMKTRAYDTYKPRGSGEGK